MRSRDPRTTWRSWMLAVLTLALVVLPTVAYAQVSIDPTATPEQHTGGWVNWMAQGAIALGGLIVLLTGAAYLRFAPRFFRSDREEEAKSALTPAPPASEIRIQYTPPPQPAQAPAPEPEPEPAAVGAPAAATAATAPPPAAEAPAAPAAAAPAAAPAAPRPAAPKHEGPVELDQETFDRVLQEQLDKGTDRRVAEGRARSAAFKAAREKAGG